MESSGPPVTGVESLGPARMESKRRKRTVKKRCKELARDKDGEIKLMTVEDLGLICSTRNKRGGGARRISKMEKLETFKNFETDIEKFGSAGKRGEHGVKHVQDGEKKRKRADYDSGEERNR